jgi:hypothetical protein
MATQSMEDYCLATFEEIQQAAEASVQASMEASQQ